MRLQAFSIRDVKAAAFTTPMFFRSVGEAMRSFYDAVKDKSSPFGKHPEDYSLFLIGEFDDQTGEVAGVVAEQVARGLDVERGESPTDERQLSLVER